MCVYVCVCVSLPCNAWQACAWYDSLVKLAARDRIASSFSGCSFKAVLNAANDSGSCSFFAYSER